MSSLYTQLNKLREADEKLETVLTSQEFSPQVPTTQIVPPKPKLTGIKVAISFSYLVGFIALFSAGFLYYSLLLETRQRQALEASHASLTERTAALEAAVDEQQSLTNQISNRLEENRDKDAAQRNEIRKEIEKRRIEIENLGKKLKGVEDQMDSTRPGMVPIEGPTTDAIAQTPMPATASVAASSTAKTFEFSKTELSDRTPKFDTATTFIRPETILPVGPVVLPPNAGKERVLTINRQFKFVVVNLGSDKSAQVGEKLFVSRDGKNIATLQVEKIYESFSAAAILEENPGAPIVVGDSIARKP